MLKFFFNAAPNPMKIALLLEELGLPFEAVPVDTRKGEQFASAFLAVNPNAKVPAITDGDVTVFDSNAILLYLADREQKFVPAMAQAKERGQLKGAGGRELALISPDVAKELSEFQRVGDRVWQAVGQI